MLILAGDIGGTKTDLLLAKVDHRGVAHERRSARFISADSPDLITLLDRFLGDARPQAAAFGIAGPVIDGRCHTTNLPWLIEQGPLAEALGLDPSRLSLHNDFHALALSIDELPKSARSVLQIGDPEATGVRAILGAGTGLGEAIVVPTGEGPRVIAGEGGHADFAPRDPLEQQLLAHLLQRHEHVSYERLLSGPGIVAIYEFLVAEGLAPPSPRILARSTHEDPAALIGELALAGTDRTCVQTIDRFLMIYGAEAGNLALKVLPRGGLFIAGGIALRLLPLLLRPPFIEAFSAKGRMRPLLKKIPVSVVIEARAGLIGALRTACKLLPK